MSKLRISEIYASIQGEGPRTGEQTIFVRFAGCNLRCPGWPCDTPHAIFPELYREEWRTLTAKEVGDEIKKIDAGRHMNICFTGGEPFLQNDEAFHELVVDMFLDRTLEVFSNGTIEYPNWAFEYLYFIMDWKMPGSGEDPDNPVRLINLKHLQPGDAVKFVCGDDNDYKEAFKKWRTEIDGNSRELIVYVGPVWGKLEPKELAEWVLQDKLPWRLNIQSHNYIWPVNERAR